MRKLTFLFAFMACSLLMWAELPFKPSTDTGNGAIWYLIKWDAGGDGVKCLGAPANLEKPLEIMWTDPDLLNPADKYLFCFVGNETDGFEIYNKAFLKGKVVDDVTLDKDLKFQTLPKGDNWLMKGGFSNLPAEENSDTYTYVDKWLPGKTNADGEYQMVDATKQFGWNKSNGSFIEVDKKIVSEDWVNCYAVTFVQVTKEPPFKVSADTGEGAYWYFIQWYVDDKDGFKCWTPNGLNQPLGIAWTDPDYDNPEDKFLYCFVGNMTDGFKIYNKAYLAGKTVGDGVVLSEDLYARELAAAEWTQVGFSNQDIDLSTVVSDWIPVITASDAMEDCYCLVDVKGRMRAWNKSGASVVETGPNTATWGKDTHKIRFVEFNTQTIPTFVSDINVSQINVSVSGNFVKVHNADNVLIDVYSLSGKQVLSNASSEFFLEKGLYIVKAGEKISKVVIR